MIKAGVGQAECIDTLNATRIAVAQCRQQMGSLNPQAGIVFASIDFDHRQMLDEIHGSFPGIELIGCTTAGEFSSAYDFSDDSVSLMVFYSDTIEIRAGAGRNASENPEAAAKSAIQQARKGLSQQEALCLVLPDGYLESPNIVIDCLNHELSRHCPVFGGSANCFLDAKRMTRQFFKNEILKDAVTLLLFAGPVEYAFSVSNSWKPVGKKALITASEGRDIMRIGDLKALDFYQYYLGRHSYPAVEFPLAVYEADGAHFYLCAISRYNKENGSVTLFSPVPQGTTVQLTEAIRNTIIEDTKASAGALTQAYSGGRPAFALAFSCALRKYILGTRTREELQILKTILPDHLPIIGFYGRGEFSPLIRNHHSHFHNATLVSLLVGEKNDTAKERAFLMPAEQIQGMQCSKDPEQVNQFLQKKLRHSETYRKHLELSKELNSALLRKVSQEIDETRQKIEEANKKIMDSIQYAKMIQRSLLPNLENVKSYLPDSFFIWMPKDIVGGDIFFTDTYGCGGGFVLGVVDCTGHGVPGAFMTMIASSALRQIIRDEKIYDPANILKRLNFIVKTTLQQDMKDAPSDDGLDAAICFVSGQWSAANCSLSDSSVAADKDPPATDHGQQATDSRQLIFAGARLPLICIHNGELKVIRGDRQSIGYKRSNTDYEFANHVVPVRKGMSFYLFTDGFADQLGGKRGRRFGSRRFWDLLKENSDKPFDEQREILIQASEAYRGEDERQDDITVVGFGFRDYSKY